MDRKNQKLKTQRISKRIEPVIELEFILGMAKSYRTYYYRFHSYCPPEAAFTTAEGVGVYPQAALPFWGGLEPHFLSDMLSLFDRSKL